MERTCTIVGSWIKEGGRSLGECERESTVGENEDREGLRLKKIGWWPGDLNLNFELDSEL